MKKVLSLMLALAMVFALASCGSNGSTDSNKGGASAASSATTDEKKDTSADSGEALSGTVSTNGSTSMEKVIGSLMEEFMAQNKDVTVTYDPTGSGTGIESVSNGSCDIGLSSRALKDTETGLVGTTVALDGIAVIVNANCGVDDLSVEQISKIYTGEITNWSEVGGADLEIACIGRESGSGTRDGFESITDTKDKCVLSQELTSTGAVISAVASSENAIGYASLSAVEGQSGIKALTVNGVRLYRRDRQGRLL